MIPIARLKGDMEFYRSLGSLVEVLKLIAAAQYQILERKVKTYRVYLDAINDIFTWLDIQKVRHPFVQAAEPVGVFAVTTDAGLLGGLNALVMDKAISIVRKENGKLFVIGKRGQLYVEDRKLISAGFPGIDDERRLEQALQLRDYMVEGTLKRRFGRIVIVFPRALSFTLQRIEILQILPFIPQIHATLTNIELADIIVESELERIAEYLVYLWLGQKIFEIFGMSRLAEQAARFMHMEKCAQRIKELDKKLKFQYFRTRHEIIDQNMRELFAARLMKR